MKILFCGDIVGRSGRDVVEKELPEIKKNRNIDFVIINGENAANGFGITKKICEKLYSIGVDVITSGNHIWDQKEIVDYIANDKRLLRPCNYPKNCPGYGFGAYKTKSGTIVVVINVMCTLFMEPLKSAFHSVHSILEDIKLKYGKCVILVDVHGESTSEKMALGHFLDGKVTAVFGTHTHVPTADLQILENGSFFQTDLGMCGDYNSVIGMRKENSILKFTHKHKKTKLETANGEGTLCGTILELDSSELVIKNFKQVIVGGKLDRK